jgi:hypothetical protein
VLRETDGQGFTPRPATPAPTTPTPIDDDAIPF